VGRMILALITISVGAFSVFWLVRCRTMLHPNEVQRGAGIVHFDGHLVMRQPFVAAHGFVVSGRV
jgi:hypothetical protein